MFNLTARLPHNVMSVLVFWDGRDASEKRMRALSDHCSLNVSAGSFACEAALNLLMLRNSHYLALLSHI